MERMITMRLYTHSDYDFIFYRGEENTSQFDINDNGSFLACVISNPTKNEIENFKMDKIRFRATNIDNIVWLTFEIGNLPIMDAPFSLHLTKNLTDRNSFREKLKTFRVVLVDSITGRTEAQLQYLLDDEFINKLSEIILKCYNMPFDRKNYFNFIESVYRSIPAGEIFRDSIVEYTNFDNKTEPEQLEIDFESESFIEKDDLYWKVIDAIRDSSNVCYTKYRELTTKYDICTDNISSLVLDEIALFFCNMANSVLYNEYPEERTEIMPRVYEYFFKPEIMEELNQVRMELYNRVTNGEVLDNPHLWFGKRELSDNIKFLNSVQKMEVLLIDVILHTTVKSRRVVEDDLYEINRKCLGLYSMSLSELYVCLQNQLVDFVNVLMHK